MIVFDLDGCLADCEHRRHFVDPTKCAHNIALNIYYSEGNLHREYYYADTMKLFKPNWPAFYAACNKDTPIEAVCSIWDKYEVDISCSPGNIQIWSGRCESVREKTLEWLSNNLFTLSVEWLNSNLKMRPIGDNTPDDQLKKRWLDERIKYCEEKRPAGLTFNKSHDIDFVFDDRPKVVRMWRRRRIFVFNCAQHDGEF